MQCVASGLQIQVSNKKEPQPLKFDFGWGAFSQSPRAIQWMPLTPTEATYQHIRLHELQEEDSLSDFLTTMASIPATMAVILINSEDSYRLSDKFHTEDQSPPVSMLVVTQETGRELLRLVRENPREVEVKVEISFRGLSTPNMLSSPNTPDHSMSISCMYIPVHVHVHVYMYMYVYMYILHTSMYNTCVHTCICACT